MAGRSHNYREFRDPEMDRKIGYLKDHQIRVYNKKRDCEDRFISSKSDSGSCGGVGLFRCGYSERAVDREPGELSSDSDSDGDRYCGIGKKRKFSPVIRDRFDKAVGSMLKDRDSRVGLDNDNCLSPRPSKIAKIQVKERMISSVELDPHISTCSSSLTDQTYSVEAHRGSNDMEASVVEDEDVVPLVNIRSSRWADDFDSPAGEGKISEDKEMPKMKNNLSDTVGIRGRKNSVTTDLGKLKRDELLGVRSVSSECDERVWSSGRGSCSGHVRDVEGDEGHHYDGGNASQSDTELEDAHGTPKLDSRPRRNVSMLHGCRSVDEFERLNKINEGTYGIVYKAREKKTGEIVALKKVKMEKESEGFPLTALREINILLSFDHSSIVNVKEIVVGSSLDDIFVVMEYMKHDLKGFLKTREQPFSQSEVKCLMLQLLKGTKYLHDNWVLHRDLKTSNLLLNDQFELKICDFGLARQYGSPLKPYTQLVVTLSYRAPELLLGAKQYSTAIDMWSLGCIMAELLSKQTLFHGKSELDQIDKIFRILGTPDDTMWPGFSKLPGVKGTSVKKHKNVLRKKFPGRSFTGEPVLSDTGFDLLSKLLTYDPDTRISAEAALEHEWFQDVSPSKDTFLVWHGKDRHTRRIMKGPDPSEEKQWKEFQQWGSRTRGVFG